MNIFSVESIVHHLSQFGEPPSVISEEKAAASSKVLRRVSSSHNVLRHMRNLSQIHLVIIMMMSWFRSERRSASMSNIDTEDLKKFNIELEKDLRRLQNKIQPPNKISETDIYIRNVFHQMFRGFICFYIRDLLQGPWRVYKNGYGRIFYHNTELQRSSWKPPRKYKPSRTVLSWIIWNFQTIRSPNSTIQSFFKDLIYSTGAKNWILTSRPYLM